MIAIDTNVLVRLVVADDARQALRARKLVEANEIVVPVTVLLESEWVLRSGYRFDRADISRAFRAFLGLPNVAPDSPSAVATALDAYDAGVDFADALHLATVPKSKGFFTFDKRLVKEAKAAGLVASLVP